MASGDIGGFLCPEHRNSCESTPRSCEMCTPENALLDFEFGRPPCQVMQMSGCDCIYIGLYTRYSIAFGILSGWNRFCVDIAPLLCTHRMSHCITADLAVHCIGPAPGSDIVMVAALPLPMRCSWPDVDCGRAVPIYFELI